MRVPEMPWMLHRQEVTSHVFTLGGCNCFQETHGTGGWQGEHFCLEWQYGRVVAGNDDQFCTEPLIEKPEVHFSEALGCVHACVWVGIRGDGLCWGGHHARAGVR